MEEVDHIVECASQQRLIQPEPFPEHRLGFGWELRVGDQLLGDVARLGLEKEIEQSEKQRQEEEALDEALADILEHRSSS